MHINLTDEIVEAARKVTLSGMSFEQVSKQPTVGNVPLTRGLVYLGRISAADQSKPSHAVHSLDSAISGSHELAKYEAAVRGGTLVCDARDTTIIEGSVYANVISGELYGPNKDDAIRRDD